jgi:hypothetical protein
MGNLGDILDKKISQLGIGRQVEAVGVVEIAQIEIAKIIPKEDFEVISFNGGVLKVKVANSSVSSEISLRLESLRRKIPEIKRIRVTS